MEMEEKQELRRVSSEEWKRAAQIIKKLADGKIQEEHEKDWQEVKRRMLVRRLNELAKPRPEPRG